MNEFFKVIKVLNKFVKNLFFLEKRKKKMQISRSNASQLLPLIKKSILEADFIAIDTELTGLGSLNERSEWLDSLQDRYTKLRCSASQYQMVQFGICTFHWDTMKQSYIAKPFHAYLFPPTSSSLGLGKHFTCQASSLTFLSSHSFDFNTWIAQGLPFVSKEEEAKLLKRLKSNAGQEIEVDESNKTFVSSHLYVFFSI